jgi:two-component system response regulator QseB
MRILVVEDDESLNKGLVIGLGVQGFAVDGVMDCSDAVAAIRVGEFDAIVLDISLPDGSGLDVLSALRASKNDVPVLVLTAYDSTSDRIVGLDLGADDYMGKPFDLLELAARLRAMGRRGTGLRETPLVWRDITLDPSKLIAARGDKPVRLSRREFTILEALMRRPGSILSKAQLEERVYGWQEDVESNTVEVHIHHLRQKLGAGVIDTVRGVGYRVGGEVP